MRFALFPISCASFFLLLGVFAAVPAFSAPITFNSALPVAEGEGIFRAQALYLRSTGDPSALDRELTVWAFPLVAVYGATPELALFGIVPFLDKELKTNTPGGGRVTRGGAGMGDITFLARYTSFKRDRAGGTFRVAPFAALKTPTGEDDEKDGLGRLPQPLQPGSGSWDPSLGVVITRQTLKWQVDASASYTFNTEANDFEFGDAARLDISYQHRAWPRKLGPGAPGFLYGVLESTLAWQDGNRIAGKEDADSGGAAWFLSPGLQYVTKRTVAEAALRLPVVQDLNGDALENDFTAILSVRVNF